MTRSQASTGNRPAPRPVSLGRYRYSKLRWRLSVHVARRRSARSRWRSGRRVRPVPAGPQPPADPARPARPPGRRGAHQPAASPPPRRLPRGRDRRPRLAEQPRGLRGRPERQPRSPGRADLVRAAGGAARAMLSAVWALGRSLRGGGYDLGIDVRGDILTVLVLALAGIPRRVGLGDGGRRVPAHRRGRVGSGPARGPLPARPARHAGPRPPTDPPGSIVHVADADRVDVAYRLTTPGPTRSPGASTAVVGAVRGEASAGSRYETLAHALAAHGDRLDGTSPTGCTPGRFGVLPRRLLAVHLGAGTAAKRVAAIALAEPGRTLPRGRLAVSWCGGARGRRRRSRAPAPRETSATGPASSPSPATAALLERADLFIGADSGPSHLAASAGIASVVLFSGTNRTGQWRPWSRRRLGPHATRCHAGPATRRSAPRRPPCMTGLTPTASTAPRSAGGPGCTARSRPMPRSDLSVATIDWRGWLALAWVVWFGLLYGKTVIESRGARRSARPSRPWSSGKPTSPSASASADQAIREAAAGVNFNRVGLSHRTTHRVFRPPFGHRILADARQPSSVATRISRAGFATQCRPRPLRVDDAKRCPIWINGGHLQDDVDCDPPARRVEGATSNTSDKAKAPVRSGSRRWECFSVVHRSGVVGRGGKRAPPRRDGRR